MFFYSWFPNGLQYLQVSELIRWYCVDMEHFGSGGAADCVFSREGSGQFRLPWTHQYHRQHTPVVPSLGVGTNTRHRRINLKGRDMIDRGRNPQKTSFLSFYLFILILAPQACNNVQKNTKIFSLCLQMITTSGKIELVTRGRFKGWQAKKRLGNNCFQWNLGNDKTTYSCL